MRLLLIQKPSPRLRRSLEEQGHLVETSQNGAGADRKVRAGDYDLVVLDLGLFGDAGLALVKKWRDDGVATPVLMLAPPEAITDKAEAFDAGADALLSAPFDEDELSAQIRALMRRVNSGRIDSQPFSELEVDPHVPMVRRSGRTIMLTRSEHELLQYLVNHRGKVVSRSMIWEHVYGENGAITSNVIDVRIHSLRSKIDKGFENPLILTLWGTGYMFRADIASDQPVV